MRLKEIKIDWVGKVSKIIKVDKKKDIIEVKNNLEEEIRNKT